MSAVWQRRLWLGLVMAVLGVALFLGLARLRQLEKIAAWTVYTDLCTVNVNLEHVVEQLDRLVADREFNDAAADDVRERLMLADGSAQRLMFFANVFGGNRWLVRSEDSDQAHKQAEPFLWPLVDYVLDLQRAGTLSDKDRSFVLDVCKHLTSVRQSLLTLQITNDSLDNLLPRNWAHLTDALDQCATCLQRRP